MAITRRSFIKTVTLGGTSFAASSGIFFPKPANSYSTNYVLSRDGKADGIFRNFVDAEIARKPSPTLPADTDPAIVSTVKSVQNKFTQRAYTQKQTPFGLRRDGVNSPLWGRQKQEDVGPNSGFGTVQIVENYVTPIAFTGATTAGIDKAIQVLGKDQRLSALELDNALIPVREQFEDWGTWLGDIDPKTGQILGTSLASYETRSGSVTRRYEVIKPGRGGFGEITLFVDAGGEFKSNLKIRVDFA
ncbi:MAG: twin-arginine translocation signal domain-containing protein [Nostochopsis sp.]